MVRVIFTHKVNDKNIIEIEEFNVESPNVSNKMLEKSISSKKGYVNVIIKDWIYV